MQTSTSQEKTEAPSNTPRRKKKFISDNTRFAYLCLIPAMLAMGILMYYPIGSVFAMAFYKTSRFGDLIGFIGWDNFLDLFDSKRFIGVINRTIIWTTLAVVIKLVLGLIIGLILNQKMKGRKMIRSLVILPWATAIPISVMLWKWTFNAEYGLLNYSLESLGFSPPIWLADTFHAFNATLTVDVWLGLPFLGLVYLAGLQAVPEDLYEAAKLEGATPWQQFYHVTLPCMRKVIMIVTLLSFFWTFNDFNTIWILTGGGPVGSTEILVSYLYRYGFQYFKWGPASAMAVITFGILLVVSVGYAYFYRKYED